MTITTEVIKAGPYNGNDVTTLFAFASKTTAKGDLRVVWAQTDGTESNLILDTDYSVFLNEDQDNDPGGTVTYPISGDPLATGETLTILNEPTYTQGSDLRPGTGADVIENALDRLTILTQRSKEVDDRTIKVPVSDLSSVSLELPAQAARLDKYLYFDENGNATAVPGSPIELASGVDETDTDTSKDKLLSNSLALGWERARVRSYGVVRMVNTTQSFISQGITGTWVVYKEDGSVLDVTGTTTQGLQEAIDYAVDNGYDLEVNGGGVKPLVPGTPSGGALGTDPFATVNTDETVTVSQTAHGLTTGDLVRFTGAPAVNGIPASEFNSFRAITKIDDDSYTIEMDTAATSSGVGGGASVRYQYKGQNGSIINCKSGIVFPPMQQKRISFGSTTLLFTAGDSVEYAMDFDSCMAMEFDGHALQVIISSTYAGAYRFKPTNELPEDPFGPVCTASRFNLGIISCANPGNVAATLDGSTTNILGNRFEISEITGGSIGALGFDLLSGPGTGVMSNHFQLNSVHHLLKYMNIGNGTSGADNVRSNYFNVLFEPVAASTAGIDVWGKDNILDLMLFDTTGGPGNWLELKSSAKNNIIRLCGTSGLSGGALITDNSTDKSNSIVTAGRIAASVHRNGTDQTGIPTDTWTKVEFTTEVYDAGGKYDNSTNYRWTPGFLGLVQISALASWDIPQIGMGYGIAVYKNGSLFKWVVYTNGGANGGQGEPITIQDLVTSSTDYYEIFAIQRTGVNRDIRGSAAETWAMFHKIN